MSNIYSIFKKPYKSEFINEFALLPCFTEAVFLTHPSLLLLFAQDFLILQEFLALVDISQQHIQLSYHLFLNYYYIFLFILFQEKYLHNSTIFRIYSHTNKNRLKNRIYLLKSLFHPYISPAFP